MEQSELKDRVAQRAAQLIFDQLSTPIYLGVGTGTTVDYFIQHLRPFHQLIRGTVSSSQRSTERLRTQGVKVFDANEIQHLAYYVDGADQVDRTLALTKGGGGAHTQEKIVAALAEQFICIVDETKCSEILGGFPVPVEVMDMAVRLVTQRISHLGGKAVLREGFRTDNGNVILDIHNLTISDPDQLEGQLNNIPGVIEAGIFAQHRPQRVIVGGANGVYELEKAV